MKPSQLNRSAVIRQAWPIIIANASVPLLGLVDTAVIGRTGSAAALGALAVSSLIFSFVYWAFGFLRMSTTGFVAQACGQADIAEAQAIWMRSLLLALGCGIGLIALQAPLSASAFSLLQGSGEVEALARDYFAIRIWGAPATLALYAVMGVCIGFGRTKLLLAIQLAMNITNMALDVLFAYGFELGIKGIAAGTIISEWLTLLVVAAGLPRWLFGVSTPYFARSDFSKRKLAKLVTVNGDMFIRTLFLLAGFAWFTNAAARLGDTVLASTHILLMLISFSAFFLDGFAFVAEERVGAALGAKDKPAARAAICLTSQLALLAALLLALCAFIFTTYGISLLTQSELIQTHTRALAPWAAAYIVLSVVAFQLDGIFIGALQSGAMRNASVMAFAILMASGYLIGHSGSNAEDLWYCFIVFVVARALCLAAFWPRLGKPFSEHKKAGY